MKKYHFFRVVIIVWCSCVSPIHLGKVGEQMENDSQNTNLTRPASPLANTYSVHSKKTPQNPSKNAFFTA